MGQDSTDGPKRLLGDTGIFFTRKNRIAIFPDADMRVHTGSVVFINGLGHKGHGMSMLIGHVF